MVESTVNYCHYEIDTTIILMSLSIEIQGLCFNVWFVGGKLLILMGALLPFYI